MTSASYSVYTAFKAKDGMSSVFKNMKARASGFGYKLNQLKMQSQNVGNSLKNSFNTIKFGMTSIATAWATNTVKQTLDSWVERASDLQETLGKTNETFKSNANEVIKWSKNSINLMGLAQQTALDTASLYGDMGTGMGMTTKRASEMSMSLTRLSADIASFKNVDQTLSMNALKGVFTGETEALKNLGTVMTQDVLEKYAKTIGINKKFKDMSQTEKIELRYKYVMAYNKNASGDFERTLGNYANQSRTFDEQKKELETRLGYILLPKYNAFMKRLNGLIGKYMGSIENKFKAVFNSLEKAFKSCKPIFKELINTFKIFTQKILPDIAEMSPIFNAVFKGVLIPGALLTIKTINLLLNAFNGVYKIIKKLSWAIIPLMSAIATGLIALQVKAYFDWLPAGERAIILLKRLKIGFIALTNAVKLSNFAFLTSPIFLWSALIGGLVAVVILLWKNWDKVTATISKLSQVGKTVFSSLGDYIKNNFLNVLQMVLNPINAIIQGLRQIFLLKQNLKGFKDIDFNRPIPEKTPPLVKNNLLNGNKTGRIDVGINLSNKTDLKATTWLDLENPHLMKLTPLNSSI